MKIVAVNREVILSILIVVLLVCGVDANRNEDGLIIFFSDSGTDKIQRANLNGSNREDLVTEGLDSPYGIALDVAGGKMYWTEDGTDKIQRANLNGSNREDLVTEGLRIPRGIAVGMGFLVNPTTREPTIAKEDVNRDGVVSVLDLVYIAERYGQTGANAADVNRDGVVNVDNATRKMLIRK